MAAAKKAAAKKANKKAARGNGTTHKTGATLPAGYSAIANTERGLKWDIEEMPLLEGTVVGIRDVEVGTGRNKRETQIMSVRTKKGEVYDVWNSKSLEEFFSKVQEGDEVAIAFQGYQDVGRGNPMKLFSAGIKGGVQDDEDEAPRGRRTGTKQPQGRTARR
jgi:hypothetical protein